MIAFQKIFLVVDSFYSSFKNSHWSIKIHPTVKTIALSKVLVFYSVGHEQYRFDEFLKDSAYYVAKCEPS